LELVIIMIRKASIADIPFLTEHHEKMFREIFGKKGYRVNENDFFLMKSVYGSKLADQFVDGSCFAWIYHNDDILISSLAVTILRSVPVPYDPQDRSAYIHSVYTEEKYRNRGHAKTLVKKAIEFCREKNIRRIDLVTSDDGKVLYEKLGFKYVPEYMRLYL